MKTKVLSKNCNSFLTILFEHVLDAQKNRPIDTVLLSIHNIGFVEK